MTQGKETSSLWESHEVESGSGCCWSLGRFSLVIFRTEGEWLVASRLDRGREPASEIARIERVSERPGEECEIVRFVASQASTVVRLVPRTADRSLVVRPSLPLRLLSGEKAKIYISAPIWVEIQVGKPMHSLCDMPVRQLSDTWFGPSTREGEVAYALRTQARVQLAELPRRRYRVITPIAISNEGGDSLLLDRINIPVPRLSVYVAGDGSLWSETVNLARRHGSDLAELKVGKGVPREVKGARRLGEPRVGPEHSFVVRAFSTLFSSFQED